MFGNQVAEVTDVAVLMPCCNVKQGVVLEKNKTLRYRQDLLDGRLDDLVYLCVKCAKCGLTHEVEVCRLAFLPKELIPLTSRRACEGRCTK